MINHLIDPQFWAIKFKRVPAEMDYVKEVLEAANL
jgi:hypothetical protein